MALPNTCSRFANLGRWPAAFAVFLTFAATAWCVRSALTEATLPLPAPDSTANGSDSNTDHSTESATTGSDVIFYQHIVDRVRHGEDYYDAVSQEFRLWKYQSKSIFNWRTPLYAWFIGKLPHPVWAQALAIVLALVTFGGAFALVERDLGVPYRFFTVFLIGPLAWCALGDAYLFTELWAGILIVLSITAFAFGRWPVGVAAALLALFIRELTMPYCLLAIGIAIRRKHWSEVLMWLVGLAAFGAFYCWHVSEVSSRLVHEDLVQAGSWIRFGGTAFVLGTTQMNVFLILLPAWITAIYLPLSLLGLLGWPGETGLRLVTTAVTYLALFAVAGLPTNAYWGLLIAPLVALGFAAMPKALLDLGRAIQGQSAAQTS